MGILNDILNFSAEQSARKAELLGQIQEPFRERAEQRREEADKRAEQRAVSRAQRAAAGQIGNQRGPFAAGLMGVDALGNLTGRTAPPEQQSPETRAANLGLAATVPAFAERAAESVFGPDSAARMAERRFRADAFAEAFKAQNEAVSQLGDDIRTEMRPVREAVQSRAQVRAMLQQGDALGAALSLVAVFKALDPNSTVRESELGEVKGGFGLETQVVNAWNIARGKGFTPESMQEVFRTLDNIVGKRALDAVGQIAGFAGELNARGIFGERLHNVFKTAGVNVDELLEISAPLIDTETLQEMQRLRAQGKSGFDLIGIF